MREVFFDTTGWLAVVEPKNRRHKEAAAFYRDFLRDKNIPLTTDYVVGEVLSILAAHDSPRVALRVGESLMRAAAQRDLRIEWITPRRWSQSWEMFKVYSERLGLSFVDATSFVVMSELKIREVFTTDNLFEKANLGFTAVVT